MILKQRSIAIYNPTLKHNQRVAIKGADYVAYRLDNLDVIHLPTHMILYSGLHNPESAERVVSALESLMPKKHLSAIHVISNLAYDIIRIANSAA
jgi:hypothetical protein